MEYQAGSFVAGALAGLTAAYAFFTLTTAVDDSEEGSCSGGTCDEPCKMVLVVRQDLGMGKGKIAAQCCHAAVDCVQIAAAKQPRPAADEPLSGVSFMDVGTADATGPARLREWTHGRWHQPWSKRETCA